MEAEKQNVDKLSNEDLVDVLWQALNKSSLKGVYTINESYLLKMVHSRLLEKVSEKPVDKLKV